LYVSQGNNGYNLCTQDESYKIKSTFQRPMGQSI
jgi:hypothetical protein